MARSEACLCLSLSALLSLLLGGCGGPKVESEPWDGPPMRLDAASGRHVVVAEVPSAGWSIGLDQMRRRTGRREAFVTLTRPNPAYLHAQVISDARLLLELLEKEPVRVHARTLDHGAAAGGAYRVAIPEPTADTEAGGPVDVRLEDNRKPDEPVFGPVAPGL